MLESKTQPQHLEYARNNPNDFIIRDLPFYHVLFKSIFDSGNTEAIDFVKESFNDHWILTGTSVRYKSGNLDEVVHNVIGNSIDVGVVGPDEWLKNANNENVYKALVNDSSKNINDFYKQINNQNSCLWRLGKQEKLIELAVGLASGSDRFILGVDAALYTSYLCFGVRG